MASIVRSSKFRHVFGTPYKRDECFENLRVSISAWDTNYVTVNPKYVAVNWNAGGGGAFAVVPHSLPGKLRGDYPIFSAHAGAVLDTEFSPFDDDIIASGAEDHQAMVWRVPGDLEEREENVTEPLLKLGGHGRKVGHVVWNPVAENVLAVSSSDYTVKVWDVQHGKERQKLQGFRDAVLSIAWNYDGSLMAATCRDKKLRIFDARSGSIVQEGVSHTGIKGSRVVWLGSQPRLVTTGFSRGSDREVFLWNAASLEEPINRMKIDMSAGMLMPFYDPSTNVLYVGGKGDGNIRYYEYSDDQMYQLSEYSSPEPQRGLGVMPKRGVDVNKCEVMRFYKVASGTMIEPITFRVPRKSESFQADIYPPAAAGVAALTADKYFAGETAEPVLIDMDKLYAQGPLVVGSGAPIASQAVPADAPPPPPPPTQSQAPVESALKAEPVSETRAPAAAPEQAPKSSTVNTNETGASLELDALRAETARLQLELAKAQGSASAAEKQAAESTQATQKLQGQLESAITADQLQAVEGRLKAAVKDADLLRAELERASGQAEEYKAKLAEASAKAQEHEKSSADLQKELKSAIDAANALALAAEKAADCLL
ncbi:Coronin-like protein crn1 [Coemansia sp. RSA 988]|nr:Coronin-like protein crn1 [Coemansia sp. RSA 988]